MFTWNVACMYIAGCAYTEVTAMQVNTATDNVTASILYRFGLKGYMYKFNL